MNIRRFAAAAALALGAGATHANSISLYSFTLTELRDVSLSLSSPGGSIVSFMPDFILVPPASVSSILSPTAASLSFTDLAAGTYQVKVEYTTPGTYSIGGTSAIYDTNSGTYNSLSALNLSLVVPENSAATLALAGVSVLGFMALRRRQAI